jgi:acyl-CoA synthetase (AMP-forming)/AMP-acid ligase II
MMSALVTKEEKKWAYVAYRSILMPGKTADDQFIHYYSFPTGADKRIVQVTYTRKQFSLLVQRAISMLLSQNVKKGDRLLMHISANRVEDLIIRTASTVIGFVPVTVNWQADSLEEVTYKLKITAAVAVIYDYQSQGMGDLRHQFPRVSFIHINDLYRYAPTWADFQTFIDELGVADKLPVVSDTRFIIFTSGTTGHPKGVCLSFSNYSINKSTFESFLGLMDSQTRFLPIVVNPLHHTNSTSITDWVLRRENVQLHLFEKYTSQFWALYCAAFFDISFTEISMIDEDSDYTRLTEVEQNRVCVLPLVSRHIDFLDSMAHSESLPFLSTNSLSLALSRSVLLIGSAPVGPTTVQRIQRLSRGHLPTVRFGSTETTLQVCGIPTGCPVDLVMLAFNRGWAHRVVAVEEGIDKPACGYYVGQEHKSFTEVKVVRSVKSSDETFLEV